MTASSPAQRLAAAHRLKQLKAIDHVMDDLFVIPGIGLHVGLDPLLGFIPGIGDAIGGIITFAGILLAALSGAPPAILIRMFFNLGVDVLVGAIPVLGDVFDFAWSSNTKNLDLFEHWLNDPRGAHRKSLLVLAGLGVVLLAMLAGLGILVAIASRWIVGLLH